MFLSGMSPMAEPYQPLPSPYQAVWILSSIPFAIVATILVMPFVMLAGSRFGLVDQPDRRRKPGQAPIPRVGGLAMVLGAILVAVPALVLANGLPLVHHFWIGIGLLLVVIVGVVDDRFGMRGRHKLLGQVVASLLIVLPGGQSIEAVQVAGWDIPLGPWGAFLAIFLLVGAMNSANLLDGMDGFLASVGLVSAATILAVAFIRDLPGVMAATCLFMGGLAGFLVFNLPPARVYLGDCGSMLVGASLALLAIGCGHPGEHAANVSLALPAGVLFLPILDTTAAIVRRGLTGRSIYSPDRSHLHHCLKLAGIGPHGCMMLSMAIGLGVGAMVVLGQAIHDDRPAWAAMAAMAATLILTGLFGRAEVRLVFRRLKALVFPKPSASGRSDADMALHLHGSGPWEELWAHMVSVGREAGVTALTLDIDMPWANESFHGRWDNGKSADSEPDQWRLELPIVADDRVIARFRVESSHASRPFEQVSARFQPVLERLKSLAMALDLVSQRENDGIIDSTGGVSEP